MIYPPSKPEHPPEVHPNGTIAVTGAAVAPVCQGRRLLHLLHAAPPVATSERLLGGHGCRRSHFALPFVSGPILFIVAMSRRVNHGLLGHDVSSGVKQRTSVFGSRSREIKRLMYIVVFTDGGDDLRTTGVGCTWFGSSCLREPSWNVSLCGAGSSFT